MNNWSITGNLGQDCRKNEVNGTAVVNFSVAVKAGFGQNEQTVWVDCSLWGKAAEGKLPDYLVKGQQVAACGEMSTQEKDGKTYIKLRCNNVDLIGKRDDSAPAPASQPQQQTGRKMPEPVDDFSDDVPF